MNMNLSSPFSMMPSPAGADSNSNGGNTSSANNSGLQRPFPQSFAPSMPQPVPSQAQFSMSLSELLSSAQRSHQSAARSTFGSPNSGFNPRGSLYPPQSPLNGTGVAPAPRPPFFPAPHNPFLSFGLQAPPTASAPASGNNGGPSSIPSTPSTFDAAALNIALALMNNTNPVDAQNRANSGSSKSSGSGGKELDPPQFMANTRPSGNVNWNGYWPEAAVNAQSVEAGIKAQSSAANQNLSALDLLSAVSQLSNNRDSAAASGNGGPAFNMNFQNNLNPAPPSSKLEADISVLASLAALGGMRGNVASGNANAGNPSAAAALFPSSAAQQQQQNMSQILNAIMNLANLSAPPTPAPAPAPAAPQSLLSDLTKLASLSRNLNFNATAPPAPLSSANFLQNLNTDTLRTLNTALGDELRMRAVSNSAGRPPSFPRGDVNVYKSIIECGVLNPRGERQYAMFSSYFTTDAEVFTAISDPKPGRVLYKASLLAHKFKCATNKLAMFLFRRRTMMDGVFQATLFLHKPQHSAGLKVGSYFVSEEACKEFESYFHKRQQTLANRRTSFEDGTNLAESDDSPALQASTPSHKRKQGDSSDSSSQVDHSPSPDQDTSPDNNRAQSGGSRDNSSDSDRSRKSSKSPQSPLSNGGSLSGDERSSGSVRNSDSSGSEVENKLAHKGKGDYAKMTDDSKADKPVPMDTAKTDKSKGSHISGSSHHHTPGRDRDRDRIMKHRAPQQDHHEHKRLPKPQHHQHHQHHDFHHATHGRTHQQGPAFLSDSDSNVKSTHERVSPQSGSSKEGERDEDMRANRSSGESSEGEKDFPRRNQSSKDAMRRDTEIFIRSPTLETMYKDEPRKVSSEDERNRDSSGRSSPDNRARSPSSGGSSGDPMDEATEKNLMADKISHNHRTHMKRTHSELAGQNTTNENTPNGSGSESDGANPSRSNRPRSENSTRPSDNSTNSFRTTPESGSDSNENQSPGPMIVTPGPEPSPVLVALQGSRNQQ